MSIITIANSDTMHFQNIEAHVNEETNAANSLFYRTSRPELPVSSVVIGESQAPLPSSTSEIADKIGGQISDILKKLNIPILNFEIKYSSHLGTYILVIIDADAQQALELWLRILDELRSLEMPIFAMWTGKADISPEEMGNYVGKALAKMGLFLSTTEPIDITEVFRKEWGA